MRVPVQPARLLNVAPPPLPPRPPQVIPNIPGAIDEAIESTDSRDWADTSGKVRFAAEETTDSPGRSPEDGGSQPGIIESADRQDSKVHFADDTELESVCSSEDEQQSSDEESESGDSDPPLLRPAFSSESLGSSSKPGYLERRKIALIQAYKDYFLEQVKAKRQKSVSTAATGILREVPFFREFDDVLPGTIYRLARLAVMQDAAEGEVLFRQGDEPVDCYVVLRGKVGVYISSAPQESPRDFTLDYVRVVEDETKKSRVSRFCTCCRFRTPEEDADLELDDSYRHYVSEGFNTYTPDSNLGTKVADLGRGAAFGELGLMERKPRGASIRCESKCTFVVIRRSAFQKWFSESISADAYRKRLYFISRIAGFQMETLRNPIKKPERTLGGKSRNVKQTVHPVDRFREEDFKPGHVLLQEGQQHEPIIFIVRSGHISVSRKSRRRSFSQELTYRDARPQRDVPFGKLGPGSIYCSLTTLGLQFPEQFTATVSSEACSLYVAKSKDLSQLPPRVTEPLLKHIHEVLRPFLCYSGAYQCMDQLVESDPKPGMEQA
mmetsp:Transcript_34738/g.83347  ORF Transcript_34738/g.83347 Transcript_34738/m.83347 type:complete len:552 (+) Transcript_34738:21-1676(+)